MAQSALRGQRDPATLAEDQVRAYFLFLRQEKRFGGSAMKLARCALRAFFRDCLRVAGWTVFEEVRIAPPQTLPLVLTREQVAALLGAVQQPRYRTALTLIYHTGLRVGEAVRIQVRDLKDTHTPHPRLHVRCGKGGRVKGFASRGGLTHRMFCRVVSQLAFQKAPARATFEVTFPALGILRFDVRLVVD